MLLVGCIFSPSLVGFVGAYGLKKQKTILLPKGSWLKMRMGELSYYSEQLQKNSLDSIIKTEIKYTYLFILRKQGSKEEFLKLVAENEWLDSCFGFVGIGEEEKAIKQYFIEQFLEELQLKF